MKDCKSKGCKHYKKDERIGIIVCEFGLHESYCEKAKEDFAVDVLEKMKKEINRKSATMIGIDKDIQVLEVNEVTEIIDKHIEELKGEDRNDIKN